MNICVPLFVHISYLLLICYKTSMGRVIAIGIAKKKGSKMLSVKYVEAVKNKGLLDDREFCENNDKKKQITLIEIENINYFNKISETLIKEIDFRRNIITEDIRLNKLLNKEFYIGEVKVKAHDLCRPCKYLQNLLKQKNLIKELLIKGGLRCEILSNGKIYKNDKIKI
jgi:MOSC domain-containing protein YiiM